MQIIITQTAAYIAKTEGNGRVVVQSKTDPEVWEEIVDNGDDTVTVTDGYSGGTYAEKGNVYAVAKKHVDLLTEAVQ